MFIQFDINCCSEINQPISKRINDINLQVKIKNSFNNLKYCGDINVDGGDDDVDHDHDHHHHHGLPANLLGNHDDHNDDDDHDNHGKNYDDHDDDHDDNADMFRCISDQRELQSR